MLGKVEHTELVTDDKTKGLQEKDLKPMTPIREAARRILDADRQQGLEEDKRIKWLRIISAVVGIALAATLQIDSLLLLEPVLGNAANAFREAPSAGAETVPPEEWYTLGDIIRVPREDPTDPQSDFVLPGVLGARVLGAALKALLVLTPGIYLSGLGAAAGSSFWHDMLDKLRSAKEVAGQVKGLAEVTKELSG